MRASRPRARRVRPDPDGPPVDGVGYHYADAFEILLDAPDARSSEEFARSALDNAPRIVRFGMLFAQRYLLGFRLGPTSGPGHIQGWKIVRAEPTVIQLEAVGMLGRAVVVGQRPNPTRAVMTTYNLLPTKAGPRTVERRRLDAPTHCRLPDGARGHCRTRRSQDCYESEGWGSTPSERAEAPGRGSRSSSR
jgi:hypothetical protein